MAVKGGIKMAKKELIATFREEWSREEDYWQPEQVVCAPNNKSVVFTCVGPKPMEVRYFFQDKLMARGPRGAVIDFAISFDGTKLAVGVRGDDAHILINGKRSYDVPYNSISRMYWLDDQTLFWSGWDNKAYAPDEKRRESSLYRNGENVTGLFDFSPCSLDPSDLLGGLIVADLQRVVWWTVDHLGRKSEERPLPREYLVQDEFNKLTGLIHELNLQKRRASLVGKDGNRQVKFGDVIGPAFHEIDNHDVTFVYNEDRSKVGYLGIKYSKAARFSEKWAERAFERYEKIEDRHASAEIFGAFFALPWLALNTRLNENSKRYFPATQDHVWKKSYRWVGNHFFTPAGKLVVVAEGVGWAKVVIDEEESEAFDSIKHPIYDPDEKAVTFVGRKGNDYYRVVVPTE